MAELRVVVADALPGLEAPVLAATRWATNADLIVDCVRLGYLRATDHVLDPTYEGGRWWTRFRPRR